MSKPAILALIRQERAKCSPGLTKYVTQALYRGEILLANELNTVCVNQDLINLESALLADDSENLENFKKVFIQYFQAQTPLNRFYVEMALLIFKPATLQDFFRILLPNATYLGVEPVLLFDENRKPRRQFYPELKEQALDEIMDSQAPPTPELLQNFVYADNLLFDVRTVENYNLQLHKDLYAQLLKHPKLVSNLYKHNTGLANLKNHLEEKSEFLLQPINVARQLINRLRAGGVSQKGGTVEEASADAHVAFLEFKDYLESLPPELKTTLLSEAYFGPVIKDLNAGDCVEVASSLLSKIIREKANDPLLINYPVRTALAPNMRITHSVKSDRFDDMPEAVATYLDVLAAYPNSFEQYLLKHIHRLIRIRWPEESQKILSLFNKLDENQQKKIFLQAQDEDHNNILMTAILDQPKAIEVILNKIEELSLYELLEERRNAYNALMLAILYQPIAVIPLLNMIKKSNNGLNILKHLVNGYNVFLLAAEYQPSVLQPLLETIKELDPSNEILEQQREESGNNALMLALHYHPEVVSELCANLPQNVLINMLLQKNKNGDNALMIAARSANPANFLNLLEIIKNLPLANQIQILSNKNKHGHNILMIGVKYQAKDIKLLLDNLTVLPIQMQDDFFKSLQVMQVYLPQVINELLELHPSFIDRSITSAITNLDPDNPIEKIIRGQLIDMKPVNQMAVLDAYNSIKIATDKDMLPAVVRDAVNNPESDLYKALNVKPSTGFFSRKPIALGELQKLLAEVKLESGAKPPQ